MKELVVYDARSLSQGTAETVALNVWNSALSRFRSPSLADAHDVLLREIVPEVENFVRQKGAYEKSVRPEGFDADGTRTIRIDDRPIKLRICGHCGAVPTEADAARAVARIEESPCDVCKEPIRVTDAVLSDHSVLDGRSTWSGCFGREDHVELHSYFPVILKKLHVRCFARVFGTLVRR